jgi:hypothetical protein
MNREREAALRYPTLGRAPVGPNAGRGFSFPRFDNYSAWTGGEGGARRSTPLANWAYSRDLLGGLDCDRCVARWPSSTQTEVLALRAPLRLGAADTYEPIRLAAPEDTHG